MRAPAATNQGQAHPTCGAAPADVDMHQVGVGWRQPHYRDVLDDLPHEMELVQRACAAASDSIRMRYFPNELVTSWRGEAL